MCFAFFSVRLGIRAVLVFDLHPDYGAAVPEQQTVHLLFHLAEPAAYIEKIGRVVRAAGKIGLKLNPIGEAAVPALPVAPGADAQDHAKPHFAA